MSKRLLLAGVVLSVVVLGAISSASWAAPVKPAIAYSQIETTHVQKWHYPDRIACAWFVEAVAPADNVACAWFVEAVSPADSGGDEFGVLLASLK